MRRISPPLDRSFLSPLVGPSAERLSTGANASAECSFCAAGTYFGSSCELERTRPSRALGKRAYTVEFLHCRVFTLSGFDQSRSCTLSWRPAVFRAGFTPTPPLISSTLCLAPDLSAQIPETGPVSSVPKDHTPLAKVTEPCAWLPVIF